MKKLQTPPCYLLLPPQGKTPEIWSVTEGASGTWQSNLASGTTMLQEDEQEEKWQLSRRLGKYGTNHTIVPRKEYRTDSASRCCKVPFSAEVYVCRYSRT